MSASASAPALGAAPATGRRRVPPHRNRAASGRRWNRPAPPAPGTSHLPERGRNCTPPTAALSGASSAGAPAGDDDLATFSKNVARGQRTLARALRDEAPASPSTNPAHASASGFHFASFPLEAFRLSSEVASNAIPFRVNRNATRAVARAQAAKDGPEGGKGAGDDAEGGASDGADGSDDDVTDDDPGTSKGSSGGNAGDDPGAPGPKKTTGEDDEDKKKKEPKKPKESAEQRRRAFFARKPELAASVVRFTETAEMLCLLTAGGVKVAQLTLRGKERLLQRTGGPNASGGAGAASAKSNVRFTKAVSTTVPHVPSPSALSLGRIGSFADASLVAVVGVHALVRRIVGSQNNNVVTMPNRYASPPPPDARANESVQFADVVSRVRARAALLADIKKDLAASRVEAGIAVKAAATLDVQGVGANGQAVSPTAVAARLEAKLAREAAEASARQREIEVSAANARAVAAEEMARAARTRCADAEALLKRRQEGDRAQQKTDEWQTETEVRTINTTRSTRGGKVQGSWDDRYGAPSDAFDAAYNNSQSNGAWHNEQQQPPPQPPQQPPQQNQLGPSSSVTYQDAVDAETLSLREEVARLRRMAEEDD